MEGRKLALDPDSAALVAKLAQLQLPRYETLSPAQARAAMAGARQAAAVVPPEVGDIRDIQVPTSMGIINARLYRPIGSSGTLPGLIFFHGGGWVLGDLESHDILCRRFANAGRCGVIAIDYRLAPEHKFPAAVEDALAATAWVLDHASDLGLDPKAIMIGGDSAGGNLAAVVALEARDRGQSEFGLQLLIYPVTDMDFGHPSHRLDVADLPVLGSTMVWFRDHYLSNPAQHVDWRASPLRAKRFADLPPAYILTAGYDPLRDEGADYAARLVSAGVPVTHRHFEGQLHGFLTMGPNFPTTETAIAEIGTAIRRAVHQGAPA